MTQLITKSKSAIASATAAATAFLFNTVPVVMAQSGLVGESAPTKLQEATGGQSSLRQLILTFLNFGLGFLGLIAVIMVIYGGILYVTAAGNEDNVNKGKKIIMYAVVGIVIILLSFALVNTVLGGLGAGQDV